MSGYYDSDAEGLRSLDSRKPWEWPIEPEEYTRQDALRDDRRDDDEEGDEE